MNMNDLVKDVHENAKAHGWWDEGRSFGELIALCHSELSEALEEYRKGFDPTDTYYIGDNGVPVITETMQFVDADGTPEKPEGIPSELADVVIRIMDMCGHYGIDLEAAILEKHEYNKTRPYKHGGKVI
ncbi:hypothetical protein LJC61_02680 [Ruminococcaceae bacterium OttesenSCG-928-A16]|nr:hypothetical protein [Ruminococcaceae bacterium OttesenSCG-928-A16]